MRVALVGDLVDDGCAEAECRARGLHGCRISAASPPEVEIIAHHHMTGREAGRQEVADEILRLEIGQRAVEGQHHHEGSTQGLDDALLELRRGQAEDRHGGLEEAARVRLEGDDAPGNAEALGFGAGDIEEFLVAPVNAVEVADRDNGTPQLRRHRAFAGDQTHHIPFMARPARGPLPQFGPRAQAP